jgi:hypothetical protein
MLREISLAGLREGAARRRERSKASVMRACAAAAAAFSRSSSLIWPIRSASLMARPSWSASDSIQAAGSTGWEP